MNAKQSCNYLVYPIDLLLRNLSIQVNPISFFNLSIQVNPISLTLISFIEMFPVKINFTVLL